MLSNLAKYLTPSSLHAIQRRLLYEQGRAKARTEEHLAHHIFDRSVITAILSRQHRRLRRSWAFYKYESGLAGYAPRGHYYSPLPDITEGMQHAAQVSQLQAADGLSGIDLRIPAQRDLLLRMCDLYPEFDWTEQPTENRRFHFSQEYYGRADSICLYAMLRLFRPRRVLEVGSGFSSALMLDVNDLFLQRKTSFTFIEPHPERLDSILKPKDAALTTILRQPLQSVPADTLRSLLAGDLLFIDSSHVSKVASDVNYLLFEIIPQLPVGVLVHVHDMFWPFEYPADWIRAGRAWNEAYLIRAFLSFNDSFEVMFWTPFAARLWPDIIETQMPAYMLDTGAALWLRRIR